MSEMKSLKNFEVNVFTVLTSNSSIRKSMRLKTFNLKNKIMSSLT